MRSRILIPWLSLVLLLSPFLAAETRADDELTIGRMRVMIWPEYDDPSILVVYDGRFADDSKFPTVTDFLIPKDAIINDICSLSPGGQHFCQLYDISEGEHYNRVRLSLPFSNFYVSFHLAPIDLDSANRQIEYAIKANHPIDNMEVDIQQPLRTTSFAISPPGGKASTDKDFNHFNYVLEDIAKGEDRVFKIAYTKETREPSVDVKYASMTGRRVWGSPYQTQRNVRTIVYAVFGTGMVLVVAALFWIVRTRRRRASP
ncbi:MAG: hypothetical protein QGG19_14565 [Alphaproteobacteria bacterium]|nr:hypothetical protein [Rhodospirillaceae bacterium]MDP6022503.1 hypothetical protein [Alphaproteobacteria bacterium]MDP6255512.1 hypothetical protein [Alphaproteobacteria bacterium]MDP7056535.1 hypothetical protein [Alphaproteobacteria bacterium]MDP7229500.1 hypothetical protein [Alphaproteobacteria bacterium]|tara:strand:- start:19122 stop:19898 length:777 start_codon:yes stop_codon:yes gene_type:complete